MEALDKSGALSSFPFYLLWVTLCSLKRQVQVLTPSPREHDCIWRWGSLQM